MAPIIGSGTYTARKLPQQLAPSGWQAILPPRTELPPLEGVDQTDVAIIGAGFAGLAAARRLTQLDPKLRITVLEALAVGEGAAGRNSGFIIDLPHEVSSESYGSESASKARDEITLNRTAIDLAKGMADEHAWPVTFFDPCGKYSIAMGREGDRHLVDYAGQLARIGEAHRLLTHDETHAVTGSKAFATALFTPGCIMIQPVAYVRAFADALSPRVRIHERTPVLSFRQLTGGWQINTPKGTLNAGTLILANNGHAESFGFFQRRLLHVFTFASLTQAFDPKRLTGQRSWAATPAHPMGTSVRRIKAFGGDRILIRSRYTYQPAIEVSEAEIAGAGRLHDRKFAARFPMLQGLPMEYRWGGAMALTWNAVPAFEESEPGLIVACGCNGVGATKASALGIAAADHLLGQKTELLDIISKAPPPRELPPQPITTIGVKASLAIRHWRAGIE